MAEGKQVEKDKKARGEKEEDCSMTKTCKRCKQSYTATSNNPNSCRYHPSFFVCRRHDDQKRYYELGPDDPPYAAKFYDCCGAEDPEASGCTTAYSKFQVFYSPVDYRGGGTPASEWKEVLAGRIIHTINK